MIGNAVSSYQTGQVQANAVNKAVSEGGSILDSAIAAIKKAASGGTASAATSGTGSSVGGASAAQDGNGVANTGVGTGAGINVGSLTQPPITSSELGQSSELGASQEGAGGSAGAGSGLADTGVGTGASLSGGSLSIDTSAFEAGAASD
jgi:hypothetical protein